MVDECREKENLRERKTRSAKEFYLSQRESVGSYITLGETNKHFDDLAPIQRMIDATSRNHFLFASIRVSRVSRVDLESRRVVASPVLVGALSVVVRRDQQKLPKRERRGEERKRIERERRGWGEE